MAINRLKIAQPTGDPKIVAFTDDILLNGLTGSGLITVTGDGQEKTVSTDASKLTLDGENVKVVTPIVLDVKTETPSTTTNALYAVKDGTENKLYWNGKLVDAHEPGKGYVTESEFDSTIGSWSSGSAYEHSTVKAAIENISAITGFKIINHRPVDGQDEGEKNTIYLYKPDGKDSYEEWIYIEDPTGTKKWEKIGDTDIKLTDYYTKTEIGTGFDTTNTVKKYIDAVDTKVATEKTRAEGVESGLNTRLTTAEGDIDTAEGKITAIEGKLDGITGTVKAYVDAEKTRATGVEGTLNSLTTDAKGNLVAAINEVDSHANTAQSTAEGRLASITGNNAGGVSVQFITATNKAVTTTVSVTESSIDADTKKFATTDKNVATGAKVQAAIDAAEQRAKTAQTYTADGTTLQLSSNKFSAKTAPVTQSSTALTTGGQVYTAIDTAKTALTGSGVVTGQDITIKGAMREAEAAQTAIGTLTDLTTDANTDLVAAINEVDSHADTAQAAADAAQTAADNAQSTANTAQSTANTNSTAIGTLGSLSTTNKDNLVAAINEVNTTAGSAVKTAEGDANINASVSGTKVTVGVKADSNLADLLSHLSIELVQ